MTTAIESQRDAAEVRRRIKNRRTASVDGPSGRATITEFTATGNCYVVAPTGKLTYCGRDLVAAAETAEEAVGRLIHPAEIAAMWPSGDAR